MAVQGLPVPEGRPRAAGAVRETRPVVAARDCNPGSASAVHKYICIGSTEKSEPSQPNETNGNSVVTGESGRNAM